jgi:hypothetical protein
VQPVRQKSNKLWLEEEIADVIANAKRFITGVSV